MAEDRPAPSTCSVHPHALRLGALRCVHRRGVLLEGVGDLKAQLGLAPEELREAVRVHGRLLDDDDTGRGAFSMARISAGV